MTIMADPAVDLDPFLDFDAGCELEERCGPCPGKATHKIVNTWCGCFWLACDACAEYQRNWNRLHDYETNWGCCGCGKMKIGNVSRMCRVVPL